MANCGNCGKHFFISGADGADGTKFCDERCPTEHELQPYIDRISNADLDRELRGLQGAKCPECDGRGPLEVWHSYSIWSAVVLTRWSSRSDFCCRSCGRGHQWTGLLTSLVLGWWGFPWGVIMTPVQIYRNLSALFTRLPEGEASEDLVHHAQLVVAERLRKEHRRAVKANRPGAKPGTKPQPGAGRDDAGATTTSPRPTRPGTGRGTPGSVPPRAGGVPPGSRKDSVADRQARLVEGDEVDDLEFL
ncbi:MAG: hypothetical protein ACKOFW_12130 [Planctomycetaceae bacterium]